MGLFGKKHKSVSMDDCIHMVEEFFKRVGLNANQHRITEEATPAWGLHRGSAAVYVSIHENDGEPSLRVFSPILFLPEEKILPFYRRCLEINRDLLNCSICAHEDKIALVSQRPIEGLDPEEVDLTIGYLAAVADELDNKLSDEFGAKMCGSEPLN